jgi:hypothetical protein
MLMQVNTDTISMDCRDAESGIEIAGLILDRQARYPRSFPETVTLLASV